MELSDLKRIERKNQKLILKLLPYWLWAVALMLVAHGIAEENWIYPIIAVPTVFAGRAVKRHVRNLPDDDDDDDYDDIIYHGVPVEAPEPLDEDRTDKPYID